MDSVTGPREARKQQVNRDSSQLCSMTKCCFCLSPSALLVLVSLPLLLVRVFPWLLLLPLDMFVSRTPARWNLAFLLLHHSLNIVLGQRPVVVLVKAVQFEWCESLFPFTFCLPLTFSRAHVLFPPAHVGLLRSPASLHQSDGFVIGMSLTHLCFLQLLGGGGEVDITTRASPATLIFLCRRPWKKSGPWVEHSPRDTSRVALAGDSVRGCRMFVAESRAWQALTLRSGAYVMRRCMAKIFQESQGASLGWEKRLWRWWEISPPWKFLFISLETRL